MALYLLEFVTAAETKADVQPLLDAVSAAVQAGGGEFIEAQVASDLERVYAIVEHEAQAALQRALDAAGIRPNDLAQVRLVGATLDKVKASKGSADYLVEWDFPPGLDMDTYLARKQAKAPLYANVPEVTFLRTYVREDMVKCLCLYDAPDEDAVRRARDAVSTPIDRLARLAES